MAKQKKDTAIEKLEELAAKEATVEKLAIEVIEPVETALAQPEDVWTFLDEQADRDYEPGFVQIKINHQTATFSTAGFGSDSGFEAIIIVAPSLRALWGFGGDEEKEEIEKWCGGLPICSSRNEDARVGKGTLVNPIDAETPNTVRHLADAIVEADYKCADCPWSQFGSIPGQKGQACKQCIRLLLWNPGSSIAGVLTVPPSSLKIWKNYKAGIPMQHYSRVMTQFGLNEQSSGQIKWSTLRFAVAGEVTEDMIKGLSKTILYKGQSTFEVKALVAEFLQLDLDKETDYPSNGKTEGDDF